MKERFHSASPVSRLDVSSMPGTRSTNPERSDRQLLVQVGPGDDARVDVEIELASEHRLVRRIRIVEARQNPGLLLVARFRIRIEDFLLHVEAHRAQVEEITVVEAGQVDLGRAHIVAVAGDVVGVGEVLVGLDQNVPAEIPARIDREVAGGSHHAAEPVRVAGTARIDGVVVECVRVGLINSGDLDAVLAVVEALAPLCLAEEPLLGVAGAGHRQVVGRREREIVGDGDAGAEFARVADGRKQEPGLALHRRVGDLECRQVAERYAEKLERGFLEADRLGLAVPDDPLGLQTPDRRLAGIVLARLAGRIDAVVERREDAAPALCAFGGEIRLVDGLDTQRVDEAVAEIVGDVDLVRIDRGAFRVDDLDVPAGDQPAGFPVVANLIGDQLVAAVVDSDVSRRGDRVVIVVVDQRVGFEQHRGALGNIRGEVGDGLRQGRFGHDGAGKKARKRRRAQKARQPCRSAVQICRDPQLTVLLVE